jgi:hypothetical protein
MMNKVKKPIKLLLEDTTKMWWCGGDLKTLVKR